MYTYIARVGEYNCFNDASSPRMNNAGQSLANRTLRVIIVGEVVVKIHQSLATVACP